MSEKSGPSVLMLIDSSVQQARVPDNDDDPTEECPSAVHHSKKEQQSRDAQWGDVSYYFS